VRGISQPESFIAAAKNHPTDGFEVTAESLTPVTIDGRGLRLDNDGRLVGEGPRFDEAYARAANALVLDGSQSGIVQTQFGYHVILLERKIPPNQISLQDRRARFAGDVYARRARASFDRCIDEQRKRQIVRIGQSFQDIVSRIQVSP
jgi:hypothetical protein